MEEQLPTQVLLGWIDQQVWVIMKNEREFVGTLKGLDEYTSLFIAMHRFKD